jgi:hypothetical protein
MNQELDANRWKETSLPLLKNKIVKEAREWLGTKFHHQASLKKTNTEVGACDCLGLVLGVAKTLNLYGKNKQPLWLMVPDYYPKIPNKTLLAIKLAQLLYPINTNYIMPGDLLLLKIAGNPQHLAIVTDYVDGGLGIIHSLAITRKVVEHRLDAQWHQNIYQSYSFYQ